MHDGVLDLAPISVVLPLRACGMSSTLGHARFVDQSDRLGIGVLGRDQLLAPVDQLLLVPLDAFEKTL